MKRWRRGTRTARLGLFGIGSSSPDPIVITAGSTTRRNILTSPNWTLTTVRTRSLVIDCVLFNLFILFAHLFCPVHYPSEPGAVPVDAEGDAMEELAEWEGVLRRQRAEQAERWRQWESELFGPGTYSP